MKKSFLASLDSITKLATLLTRGKYRREVTAASGDDLHTYYYQYGYSPEQAAETLLSAVMRNPLPRTKKHITKMPEIWQLDDKTPAPPSGGRFRRDVILLSDLDSTTTAGRACHDLIEGDVLPGMRAYFANMSLRRLKKLSKEGNTFVLPGLAEIIQKIRSNV